MVLRIHADEFITRVPSERHREALEWFLSHSGSVMPWAEIQLEDTRLRSTPKGIYKPKEAGYALSVRQTQRSMYSDVGPFHRSDGTWIYKYHEETPSKASIQGFGSRTLY
jgi:hypothetical protein